MGDGVWFIQKLLVNCLKLDLKESKLMGRKRDKKGEATGPKIHFTNLYIFLVRPEGTETFPLTQQGLVDCFQILSRELGLDSTVDAEDELVLPFRRSGRPVIGVNHR